MKWLRFILLSGLVIAAVPALAAQISVPSAASSGYFLVSTTTGAYVATTTDPAHFGSIFATSTTATSIFNGSLSVSGTVTAGTLSGLIGGNNGALYAFASSSLFGFTPPSNATTLTVAGTANQISSSAGAQDLTANRTWTLSLPNHVIFPGDFLVGNSTTTNATTTGSAYFTGLTGAGGELDIDANNRVYKGATSTLTTISGQLSLTSQVSGILPYGNGGTGSTTAPVSQVLYGGATAYQSEATGTVTCTGNASCGAGSYVLGANLTINAAGGSGSGLATSSPVSGGNLLEYSAVGAGSAFGIATTAATVNNGLTGTLTTINNVAQTIGLANIANGNVLGFVGSGTGVPTAQATSTLYGTGSGGQVLTWANGAPAFAATSTDSCSSGVTCSFAGTQESFSIGALAITNGMLANSTISGVVLGGSLSNLTATANGGLTFSVSYNGSAAATVGLNTTSLVSGALDAWNGSNLAATGTPQLTVGNLLSTTTASSTFVGALAIGSTSPWSLLSAVVGTDFKAHALSTVFLLASSTAGNATTTLFSVDSAGQASSTKLIVSSLGSAGTTNVCASTLGLLTVSGCNNGTVTSVTGNNGLTGTVTTSGNIGLAAIAANSLLANNTSASAVPVAVATSTLYGTCTGGQVVGWSNVTGGLGCIATSSSGSGANPGGSATNIQYQVNGTTFGGVANSAYTTQGVGNGYFGLGTTTPAWTAEFASSSQPQLALSDTIAGDSEWTFRNISGALYIATASPTTYGTSTIAALQISTNGNLIIGSNGSAASPAFASSAGSGITAGIFFQLTNTIGFSSNGTQVASINSSGINLNNNGSAGTPALKDNGNDGVFFLGNGLGLSSGGTEAARFTTAASGIGSTTPSATLSIGTTTALSASLNAFAISSSTNQGIFNISYSGLFGFASITPSAIIGEQSTYIASGTPLFYSSVIGSATPALYVSSPNNNGWVGIGTTSPWAGLSINAPTGFSPFAIGSSSNPIAWVDSLGKWWDRDILNNWSGIITPTKYISLGVGTTTTMLGTSTAPYIPQTVLSYAGTVKTAQCLATSTGAFIGIQPYIGTTALTFFVASNTVGTMTFTSSNTFTAGQALSFAYGTGTALANNQAVSCTFSAIQTQ